MFPSDESLMRSVARGEMAALEQLVMRHQQAVWRSAYRLLGDHQAAEDIAQDAFLRLFKAAGRYRPTATFRTYLYRIVVRLCWDYLKKGRAAPAEIRPLAPDGAAPEEQAAAGERARAVQQALTRLPAKQRAAVVLRYYEGLSHREMAEAMGMTAKAVERLLARGRVSLQKRLAGLIDS